ncbi:cyclic nucleotide-binding-like protein [Polychytrium aggregatum]|uniref:cyclic nucleotide-binding-like protein n=1 Tax=Polychytrium aggregatum TaxID=110093 RepID=UPI0022FEEF3B|nr:cyclic nucleotide-binding-like protein [Polychytrium aggregatum]KAI9204389.1 cyclic nucleotide-binding-like protein [Polychytrium aggregatum]
MASASKKAPDRLAMTLPNDDPDLEKGGGDTSKVLSILRSEKTEPKLRKLLQKMRTWLPPVENGVMQEPHPFWTFWDALVRINQCINLFLIPLQAAWTCSLVFPGTLWIAGIMDLIEIVEVIFRLVRSYEDEFGYPAKSRRQVQGNFLRTQKGTLIILTVFPADLALYIGVWIVADRSIFTTCTSANLSLSRIWSILRIARLYSASRGFLTWFLSVHLPGTHVSISRLIKNVLAIITISHYFCCVFWFLNTFETSPDRWIDVDHLLFDANGVAVPFGTQYLFSYYSALKAVFFIFRSVNTDVEKGFSIFEVLMSSCVFGSLFGNIVSLIRFLDESVVKSEAEERIIFRHSNLRDYMRKKAFPVELQKRITAYEKFFQARSQGLDEKEIFQDMPYVLRGEIALFLYGKYIDRVPLFRDRPQTFKRALSMKMRTINVAAGWYLFHEGDDAQEMYVIRKGEVEVCSGDGQTVFMNLKKDSFFGEITLFEECTRTASVRAVTDTEMCVLLRMDARSVFLEHPAVLLDILSLIEDVKRSEEARVEPVEPPKDGGIIEEESEEEGDARYMSTSSIVSSEMERRHDRGKRSPPVQRHKSLLLRGGR